MERFGYSRAAGTAAEARAAGELCAELERMGLSPLVEPFSFEISEIVRAGFRITRPYRRDCAAGGYAGSACTEAEGLSAPFFYVENGDPVSLSRAAGAIALINGPVTAEVYHRLEAAGIRGFASICGTPLDQGPDRVPVNRELRHVEHPSLPGVCIHYQDAREIVERGARDACLQVEQRRVSRRSQNVIARIPGTERADETILLSAHYDCVPMGPGAYDNMAGVAIVLEACRYFTQHPPKRTLVFAFFGAEECGLQGSRAFVRAHGAELPRCQLNLNVDLAGQLVGGTVLGVTADPSLCEVLERLLWQGMMGAEIRHQVWSGDANTFASGGVPAVTLDRDGFGMHTRYDTIELISPWALERDARLLTFLTQRFDRMERMPFCRRIPEEMMRQLEGCWE